MFKFIFLSLIFASICMAKPSQVITPISQEAKEVFDIMPSQIFKSKGIKYKIFIAKTKGEHKSYKSLYILDANAQFPMFLNSYAKNLRQNDSALLIIGIGYDTSLAYDKAQRTRDYTFIGDENLQGGKAEQFYTFLNTQLFPYIQKHYPTEQKAFFGHSFGGLFGLYVYLHHNESFDTYFIASPSLWWAQGAILKQDFSKLHCKKQAFITQGSLENAKQRSKVAIMPTSEFTSKLSKYCPASFKLFEGKTHGGVIPDAILFSLQTLSKQAN